MYLDHGIEKVYLVLGSLWGRTPLDSLGPLWHSCGARKDSFGLLRSLMALVWGKEGLLWTLKVPYGTRVGQARTYKDSSGASHFSTPGSWREDFGF